MIATDSPGCSWILADGHVHFYKRFSERSCFDWALHNFNQAATRLELEDAVEHVLFLTESADDDWFRSTRLAMLKGLEIQFGSYRCRPTDEENSLCLETESCERIFVIAGRQIVSSERLEILALGLNRAYADGQPLHKTLENLLAVDCLAVLPWGAGKWTGKRRRIVVNLFRDAAFADVFIGDSGNRPYFWPCPDLSGPPGGVAPRNLPGSDPLPLRNQERRIGSFGFVLKGPLNTRQPFTDLKRRIKEATGAIRTFGTEEGLLSFFLNQTAMQLRRFRKSS